MKKNVTKLFLFLSLVLINTACISDTDETKQALILEYFKYIGLDESVTLQVEMMSQDYVDAYDYLPKEFWENQQVQASFDNYKVSLLRGYVESIEREVSMEDLEFIVAFYSSEDGRRVVEIGKRVDPFMVAASAESGREFSETFTQLVENYSP